MIFGVFHDALHDGDKADLTCDVCCALVSKLHSMAVLSKAVPIGSPKT